MALRPRSERPWTWGKVRERALAVYASAGGDRARQAVLLWQGDDPRVEIEGGTPPLVAITMDVEQEASARNAVAIAGFDSLEAARAHCVEWVGSAAEVGWDALGEAAQIGVYASIREPGFAEPGPRRAPRGEGSGGRP